MKLIKAYIREVLCEKVDLPIRNEVFFVRKRGKELSKALLNLNKLYEKWPSFESNEDVFDNLRDIFNYYYRNEKGFDLDDIESSLRRIVREQTYKDLVEWTQDFERQISQGSDEGYRLARHTLAHIKSFYRDDEYRDSALKDFDLSDLPEKMKDYGEDWLDKESFVFARYLQEVVKNISHLKHQIDLFNKRYSEHDSWKGQVSSERTVLPDSDDIETLYHASLNAGDLYQQGFDSHGKSSGLGGQSEGMISFTHDFRIAQSIMRVFKVIKMIHDGDIGTNQVLSWIKKDPSVSTFEEFVDDGELKGFDFDDSYFTFKLFNKYLWMNKTLAENPVLTQTSRGWFNSFANVDANSIGIIVADVNVKHPKTLYLAGEKEFRVVPEAVVKINKFIS